MFYIDNIISMISSVVCSVSYVYVLDFTTRFYNALIKIKPLLINVFVLLDILSNDSKYQQLSTNNYAIVVNKNGRKI